jgi:acetylornithine/succinyldiaminopimelate/putrescine aminotransferase
VEKRARALRRGLNVLARKHSHVVQVRSLGLIVGVEMQGPAAAVVKGLRDHRILATRAGDNVLRLLPPLVIKQKDIRQLLEALDEVLATGAGSPVSETAIMKGTGGAVA